jgi:hypothetical protein
VAASPYRLPRRYRPRRKGGSAGPAVAAAVFAALLAASGAKAVPHHGHATAARGSAAAVYVPAGSNEALANSMAVSYGWTRTQATCLDDLWTEESGFSAYAANPASDARGIPQNISGWSASYQPGNARQQIAWGLGYIRDRYGSPCAAWAFETSHVPNWY